MSDRKIIFFDLDGTLIDHSINAIPKSTKETIDKLKQNGHVIVIATGRPPCLIYNVDKDLGIETVIASNGRYVISENKVIWNDYIDPSVVERFTEDMKRRGIDLAFESQDDFVISGRTNSLVDDFISYFNLKTPPVAENFHKNNKILQMVMFYDNSDFSDIQDAYPELDFNISCPYGVDINVQGGMKEVGVKKVLQYFGFDIKDTIAVGDGYNDIAMIKIVNYGIAMGNACEPLKEVADFVTEPCNEDGIYKAFKKLNMI